MSKPAKYVAKGATVEAVEVGEANLDRLVEQHSGTAYDSARQPGLRYAVLNGPGGSYRIQPGCTLVTRDGLVHEVFCSREDFDKAYERP